MATTSLVPLEKAPSLLIWPSMVVTGYSHPCYQITRAVHVIMVYWAGYLLSELLVENQRSTEMKAFVNCAYSFWIFPSWLDLPWCQHVHSARCIRHFCRDTVPSEYVRQYLVPIINQQGADAG